MTEDAGRPSGDSFYEQPARPGEDPRRAEAAVAARAGRWAEAVEALRGRSPRGASERARAAMDLAEALMGLGDYAGAHRQRAEALASLPAGDDRLALELQLRALGLALDEEHREATHTAAAACASPAAGSWGARRSLDRAEEALASGRTKDKDIERRLEEAEAWPLNAPQRLRLLHLRARAALQRGDAEDARQRLEACLAIAGPNAPPPLRERAQADLQRLATRPSAADPPAGADPGKLLGPEDRSLLDMVQQVLAGRDLQGMLDLALLMAVEAVQAQRGFILLLADADGPQVRCSRNIDAQEIASPLFKLSQTVVQQVAERGRAWRIADARSEPALAASRSAQYLELRSVIALPIIGGRDSGVPIGVLYLDDRFRADHFTPAHQALLERFAALLAGPLEVMRSAERTRAALAATRRAHEQALHALGQRFRYERIVARSAPMAELFRTMDALHGAALPVLILGESGTGKELVARALHHHGPRAAGPFVAVNAAAFSESLLEAELFGHVAGAFTGALQDRPGLLLSAHGGTLFLDEVGEMPLALQAKLLRVLETGEFRPLGADVVRQADVRWICATHRDLVALTAGGAFRQDLYYRLAGATLRVPPLRRRREDIEPLAERFLLEAAGRGGPARLGPEALRKLWGHAWPGNVRELRNVLLRAAMLAGAGPIGPEHLLLEDDDAPASDLDSYLALPLKQARERFTADYLRTLLERHGGNITHAATEGGTSRQALQHHLKKYGLSAE